MSFVAVLVSVALWVTFLSRGKGSDSEPQKVVRVCIVYSGKYGISLGGLERLHPFDIHKYKLTTTPPSVSQCTKVTSIPFRKNTAIWT